MPWDHQHQTVGLDEPCPQMFGNDFSSTRCAPGTVLGAGDTAVNKARGGVGRGSGRGASREAIIFLSHERTNK